MAPIDQINLVADENGNRHQGVILALNAFPGEILVENCTFKNNKISV